MYKFLQRLPKQFLSFIVISLFSILLIILIVVYIQSKIISENKKKIDIQNSTLKSNAEKIIALESNRIKLIKENSNHANYLSSVFTSMREGIIVFNKDYKIVLANPFAMDTLNLDNSIFFDNKLIENKYLTEISEMLLKIDDDQPTYEVIKTNDNKVYLKFTLERIQDKYNREEELGYFVSIHDVSETELNNRLRNEFIENISHEFKTPMTIILGYVETLRLWDDLEQETVERSLEVIDIEVNRLNSMVDQLLSLTKVNGEIDITRTKINAVKVVKSVIGHFQSLTYQSKVSINLEYDDENIIVEGDHLLLINAITNIIDNAIKYTFEYDTINIKVHRVNDDCVISIKDNGPGIQKAHLDRIFERFYRIEKDRNSETGGTGLGLSITKNSIEKIGGYLKVISEENKGTEFQIILPL